MTKEGYIKVGFEGARILAFSATPWQPIAFFAMSLRNTAYYGLLFCLVALFALGLQPLRYGKSTVAPRSTKEAPAEESGDEEESESETESSLDSSLRRRGLVGLPESDQGTFLPATIVSARMPRTFSFALPQGGEQAARNGIGGPLRL